MHATRTDTVSQIGLSVAWSDCVPVDHASVWLSQARPNYVQYIVLVGVINIMVVHLTRLERLLYTMQQ